MSIPGSRVAIEGNFLMFLSPNFFTKSFQNFVASALKGEKTLNFA